MLKRTCHSSASKQIFEVPIAKVMKQTKGAIPNVVEKTVKYIEEKGMPYLKVLHKAPKWLLTLKQLENRNEAGRHF